MLPLYSHEVNAGHALHFFELLNLFHGKFDAFSSNFTFTSPLETLDQGSRHIHARHLLCHVPCHTYAFHGGDTSQNIAFLVKPHVNGPLHEFPESIHVINTLGLDEVGPGSDFFGQAVYTEFKGLGKWVGCRANKEFRRHIDILAIQESAFIPHGFDRVDQLHGVNVKDIFGLRMITESLMVAGKAEHIPDPMGIDPKNIALYGQAVAIATDHLKIGLQTLLQQDKGGGPAGHAHHCGLIIRNIHRVHTSFQVSGLFFEMFNIGALRRSAFTGKSEMSCL